jgi:hypothetical protein
MLAFDAVLGCEAHDATGLSHVDADCRAETRAAFSSCSSNFCTVTTHLILFEKKDDTVYNIRNSTQGRTPPSLRMQVM